MRIATEELIELWLEHCRQAKHTTQAEAFNQGKKENNAKYATYSLAYGDERIYCRLKGCNWTGELK